MNKLKKYFPTIIVRIWRLLFLRDLALGKRLSIVVGTFVALGKNAIFRKKSLRYFGKPLIYEYWSDPLTMLAYPHEIATGILKQIEAEEIQTVLDIGGNIGQFSVTLTNMADPRKIDVLEPNSGIIDILKTNTRYYDNIKVYNLGVGKKGKQEFYYEQARSAIGSVIKENAYHNSQSLRKVEVEFTDNVSKITKTQKYDLVKIDVEGFEYDVIKNLKGVKAKYMFIEISTNREKPYIYSQILKLIAETFGEYELLYQDYADADLNSFDILLEFK